MSHLPPYEKMEEPPEGDPRYSEQPGYLQQPGDPQQPGYPQQQQEQQGSETVIQQSVVATSVVQQYRESPVRTMCPYCRARILTFVRYDVGAYTWIICAIVLFFTGALGCCIFPFCIDECKDVVHFCPSCEQQIARWNRN